MLKTLNNEEHKQFENEEFKTFWRFRARSHICQQDEGKNGSDK